MVTKWRSFTCCCVEAVKKAFFMFWYHLQHTFVWHLDNTVHAIPHIQAARGDFWLQIQQNLKLISNWMMVEARNCVCHVAGHTHTHDITPWSDSELTYCNNQSNHLSVGEECQRVSQKNSYFDFVLFSHTRISNNTLCF